jgi:DNA-binding transcriptional MocR family regulator
MVISGRRFMMSASNMVCLENSGALAKIELTLNTDIIICEDDPYSFLQFPAYIHGGEAALNPTTPQEYLDSLVPSFLKYDTQGRVIRLDTFSKVKISLNPTATLAKSMKRP